MRSRLLFRCPRLLDASSCPSVPLPDPPTTTMSPTPEPWLTETPPLHSRSHRAPFHVRESQEWLGCGRSLRGFKSQSPAHRWRISVLGFGADCREGCDLILHLCDSLMSLRQPSKAVRPHSLSSRLWSAFSSSFFFVAVVSLDASISYSIYLTWRPISIFPP